MTLASSIQQICFLVLAATVVGGSVGVVLLPNIVYSAFERVESKLRKSPIDVFHEGLDNIKPSVEVRSRRVGGAT